MSDDLRTLFSERVESDTRLLAETFGNNNALKTLLTSLADLKGNGYKVSVDNLTASRFEQDGETYKAPVVHRTISVEGDAVTQSTSLKVTLNVDGEYSFEAAGAVNESPASTTVSNQASNNVQQWLVDVQVEFGIDILGTAMARTEERAEVAGAEAEKRKSRPKPA